MIMCDHPVRSGPCWHHVCEKSTNSHKEPYFVIVLSLPKAHRLLHHVDVWHKCVEWSEALPKKQNKIKVPQQFYHKSIWKNHNITDETIWDNWIQLNTVTNYQHNSTALRRMILKEHLCYIDARMFLSIITLKTCGAQTGRDLCAE